MARRGPKEKPAHELSSRRARERGRLARAVPSDGTPQKPRWIDRTAAAEWDRVLPALGSAVVAADANMLARYCQLQVQFRRLMKRIVKEGEIVEGEGSMGQPIVKRNPAAQAAMEVARELRMLEQQLFMSPAARPASAARPTDEDEQDAQLQRLMHGKGFKVTG
ncbi:MAG: phage terminase small subunit P27 family [Planctomycetota bacterium]